MTYDQSVELLVQKEKYAFLRVTCNFSLILFSPFCAVLFLPMLQSKTENDTVFFIAHFLHGNR